MDTTSLATCGFLSSSSFIAITITHLCIAITAFAPLSIYLATQTSLAMLHASFSSYRGPRKFCNKSLLFETQSTAAPFESHLASGSVMGSVRWGTSIVNVTEWPPTRPLYDCYDYGLTGGSCTSHKQLGWASFLMTAIRQIIVKMFDLPQLLLLLWLMLWWWVLRGKTTGWMVAEEKEVRPRYSVVVACSCPRQMDTAMATGRRVMNVFC